MSKYDIWTLTVVFVNHEQTKKYHYLVLNLLENILEKNQDVYKNKQLTLVVCTNLSLAKW